MKHSIRRQFATIFITLMTVTILLCWLLNTTLLEKYYVENKKDVLLAAYKSINDASNAGNTSSEEFQIEVQKISGIYNINILVINANSQPITSSVHDYDVLVRELLDHVFNAIADGQEVGAVLEQTDRYTIQNNYENRTNINYIEMWGFLDNGNPFIMRTALEGIRDSVTIANRFLMYIGIFAVLLSGVIIWLIARKITNPIMALADISLRMINLDFEAKYTGNEKNEIGILGEHMNELSDKLEKTISELKTANNELMNDIEKKEQMDEMRREFLSNVSHELKTPIALVMGYAEGLKMNVNDDPESREFYCDVIMDEAQKMDTLVKKLLTLNQLEFGNDIISMERFDIVEMIRNYLSTANILIENSQAKIFFLQEEAVYVWGDEFKTEEVFMNYFTNALNHLSGEREIRINVQRYDDVVRVVVFNTGEQIPEESIPYLWDKFYKVDKARTREYGGSGVGLSIVKAIMESMNRAYGVKNCKGGVEFWFELECK
ncbi:MAG: HAMP domain-containing protein [Lachnospiraceae bacterium]|nr:HAMP domain-containing protein [Lachnospiraceae bacterium]